MAPDIRKIIENADILELQARDKEGAIRELVDALRQKPEVTDADDFLRHIIEREKVISTGIGIGVAMPHVKIHSVTDFVLAIGRCQDGLDFDSLDGHPVHLIAMIGASEKQSGDFLKVLARLVLKLKNREIRERIQEVEDLESIRSILLEGE